MTPWLQAAVADFGRAVCPANEGIETPDKDSGQPEKQILAARSAPLMRGLKLLDHRFTRHIPAPMPRGLPR